MINLNAHWVNGKTYRELFEEGLESKSNNYFRDLYHSFSYDILPIIFPDYVHDIESAKEYLINDPETLITWVYMRNSSEDRKEEALVRFNQENNYILYDEKMIELQVTTMTREFSVVALAVSEIKGKQVNSDFGLAQIVSERSGQYSHDMNWKFYFPDIYSDEHQNEMNRRLSKFIDPMLYLITYCLMSRKNLSFIDIW